MLKKITSITKFTTGEGERISYTYSELDEKGNMHAQNKQAGFILMDENIKTKIKEIEDYIANNYLNPTEGE